MGFGEGGRWFSNLYTKRLSPNSYQESVRYTSVALCAVGTSVTLRYLRPSVTPCAYYIRLLVYHSIFQKNLFLSHLRFEFSLHNSDENTNGLLREYFPKAVDINQSDFIVLAILDSVTVTVAVAV